MITEIVFGSMMGMSLMPHVSCLNLRLVGLIFVCKVLVNDNALYMTYLVEELSGFCKSCLISGDEGYMKF